MLDLRSDGTKHQKPKPDVPSMNACPKCALQNAHGNKDTALPKRLDL